MNTQIVATKRYIYNLEEELSTIAALGRYPPDSDVPQAWIVEHLRDFHRLDVGDLPELTQRSDVYEVPLRCGERIVATLTRSLYRTFFPMACHALNAAFTDMRFTHDHLSVTVYDNDCSYA